MDRETREYRRSQLSRVLVTQDDDIQPKIKIVGSHESTHFLDITKKEMIAITQILLPKK